MRKLLSVFILWMTVVLIELSTIHSAPNFEIISQTIDTVEGVTHREIIAQTWDQNERYNQVINYLSANPQLSHIHVITGDDYPDLSYGMRPLHRMAQAVDERYSNYRVIGGINGDFYNLNSGIPVEAYVRNGDVVSPGLGNNRPVVGFKDDGTVVFGRPCFLGFELTVFDEQGRIKIELPVQRINRLPNDDIDVTVYFENFDFPIPSNLNKYIIQGSDIKRDAFDTRYFGRGTMIDSTEENVSVAQGHFVIVSNNPYIEGLLTSQSEVRVQERIGCEFEGVRFAIGAYEHLVSNGVVLNIDFGTAINARVPRSAIGQKADGSIFFLAVDGRQALQGRTGVTLPELAEIMAVLGAVEAYNLDGGGSTSMVLRQENDFVHVNEPSDPGGPRSLSNALFFATGTHQAPPNRLEVPDLSRPLLAPQNVRVENTVILWDHVMSRTGYRLKIETEIFNVQSNQFDITNLSPGLYSFRVQATAEGPYVRDSEFSPAQDIIIYPETYHEIVTLFRDFVRYSNPSEKRD